jgi:hypothetical protein
MPDDEGSPESQQVEAQAQRTIFRTISSGLSSPYEIQIQLKQEVSAPAFGSRRPQEHCPW